MFRTQKAKIQKNKKGGAIVQYLWKMWKKDIPMLNEEYDIAVSYIEGTTNYFVIDKVKAKRKILWMHTIYDKWGYTSDFDKHYFEKADNARLDGKMQMHYRFSFDGDGIPMLYVFNTCPNFIRTIPALVYSQTDPEDVDTTQEDHIYDECRYVCMAHPLPPPIVKEAVPKIYNPLESDREIKYDPYEFYR